MIPLHVHSYYTLLGATPNVEALAKRAAAAGLSYDPVHSLDQRPGKHTSRDAARCLRRAKQGLDVN